MQAMIDTLKTARTFETAGFATAQAEALVNAMAELAVASREDLVTKDFLKGEVAQLRSELRIDIANSRNDMIRWLLGSQATLVIVLVALVNFTRTFG